MAVCPGEGTLVGDGLDDLGAGDEHVGGVLDHEREIGDGGRVHSTACLTFPARTGHAPVRFTGMCGTRATADNVCGS